MVINCVQKLYLVAMYNMAKYLKQYLLEMKYQDHIKKGKKINIFLFKSLIIFLLSVKFLKILILLSGAKFLLWSPCCTFLILIAKFQLKLIFPQYYIFLYIPSFSSIISFVV